MVFRSSVSRKADDGQRPRKRSSVARSQSERQLKFQNILEAAFTVFSAKGYAATRLEDVAKQAGIGKGTIYLYASSKQDLFEAMIRHSFLASFDMLETTFGRQDLTLEQHMTVFLEWFNTDIIGTSRGELVRLILREAKQFPELAAMHHRLVVSRGITLMRLCFERARASGEIIHDEVSRFPQLVIAPALLALVWSDLFQELEQVNIHDMLNAHRDLLLRGLKGNAS